MIPEPALAGVSIRSHGTIRIPHPKHEVPRHRKIKAPQPSGGPHIGGDVSHLSFGGNRTSEPAGSVRSER